MRKSIATVSLSGMLREKLEAIAAARFDDRFFFEIIERRKGYSSPRPTCACSASS